MQVLFATALVAAAATLTTAAGPCGDKWACPTTESKVCGTIAGTDKTYTNVCEAFCAGASIKKRAPCVEDLVKLFALCKTFDNKMKTCSSVKGCTFQETYEGSGAAEDFFEGVAQAQGCESRGGSDKDKCNGLKKDDKADGERDCMFVSYGGDEGSCLPFEPCQAATASNYTCSNVKGKDGKPGCIYQESVSCAIQGSFYGESYPTDEPSCKQASGEWTTYKSCMQKFAEGPAGAGGGGAAGGDYGGSSGAGSDNCESQYTKKGCESLKDDDDKPRCTVSELEANGYCELKTDATDQSYTCWNVSNPGSVLAEQKKDCNADSQCEYKEMNTGAAASILCETFDPCKQFTKEASCTGKCVWYGNAAGAGAANTQQCFFDEYGATGGDTGAGGAAANDKCGGFQEKTNCLAAEGDDGEKLCTYAGSEGACTVGDAGMDCLCTENCPDGWDNNEAACNKVKDTQGNQCKWDKSRAFSMCLQKSCYNVLGKVDCEGSKGCEWTSSAGAQGSCGDKVDGGAVGSGAGPAAGGSCYDFQDEKGATDKCRDALDKDKKKLCAVVSNAQGNCKPQSTDAADAVWNLCSQFGSDKTQCEANKCTHEVISSSYCVDAGSCEQGKDSKEACDKLTGCDFTAEMEVDGFKIPALCSDSGEGEGDGGAGPAYNANPNGTCTFDSTRQEAGAGGEVYAGSGYTSSGYGTETKGQCVINATEVKGRTECGQQRDINGLQACEVTNRTRIPGQCAYKAPAGAATTTAAPGDSNGGGGYEYDYANNQCESLQDAVSCTANDECVSSSMHCTCTHPDKLPAADSSFGGGDYYNSAYGGGNSYGGGGDSYGGYNGGQTQMPATAYQCKAAPADAKCAWVEQGACIPMNTTTMTDEQMQERCYSVSLKDKCVHPKCLWSSQTNCQSKTGVCNLITDAKECGDAAAKAQNCAYSAPVIDYTCEARMASPEEKCAKYDQHDGCSSEPGCAFSKDVEDFYNEYLGSGFEDSFTGGNATEGDAGIFLDCFGIRSAPVCEKATGVDPTAACATDAAAAKPKSAEDCAKVDSTMCSTTDGCKSGEVKKCSWAKSSFVDCIGNADEDMETCSPLPEAECKLDAKCTTKVNEVADCIAFDPCATLSTKGKDTCEKKKGCTFEGVGEDEGSCMEKTNENPGEDMNMTTGSGSKCFSFTSKSQCDPASCEWMSGGMGMGMGMGMADRCYYDFAKAMGGMGSGADMSAGGGTSGGQGGDLMGSDLNCYQHRNASACEKGTSEKCLLAAGKKTGLNKCLAKKTAADCGKADDCAWQKVTQCKFYQPKETSECSPTDMEDYETACWEKEDAKLCAADSKCKATTTQYNAICSPNSAADNFAGGSAMFGSGSSNGDGGNVENPDGDLDNIDAGDCATFPEECCQNAFTEDKCNKLTDQHGDKLCAYSTSKAIGYCGGELCNATLTLGLNQQQCDALEKCSWVVQNLGMAQCTHFNKCHGLNATSCKSLSPKGCQYAGGDEEGAGFDQNSQGYCGEKVEGGMGESPCYSITGGEAECNKNDKCAFKKMDSGDDGNAGDTNMYEAGYCSAPMNMDMDADPTTIVECDDSIGDRSYNKTSCAAAKGCKWFSADTDTAGMGMEEDQSTMVSNCLARPGFLNGSESAGGGSMGSDLADNAGTGGGSGFGDSCIGANAMCQCHDTSTECSNDLDTSGVSKCSWKTFDDVPGAQPQCMNYNKCDQPTESKCQAQKGCAYYKDFDAVSGGVVGHCRTFEKFVKEDGANYTCVVFVEPSNEGYNGDGYGTTATTVSTTSAARTTTASTTSAAPTTTKTTVTTKEDEVRDKDGNAQNEDVFTMSKTTPSEGATTRTTLVDIKYFDVARFSIDVEFENNRFDTLEEYQRRDLDYKANRVVQSRMEDLGIDTFALLDVKGFAEGKDEPDSWDYLALSVRIFFKRSAVLTVDEVQKMIKNLAATPLKINIDDRREVFSATAVVLAAKADHPFWRPLAGVVLKSTSTPAAAITDKETGEELSEFEQEKKKDARIAEIAADEKKLDEETGNLDADLVGAEKTVYDRELVKLVDMLSLKAELAKLAEQKQEAYDVLMGNATAAPAAKEQAKAAAEAAQTKVAEKEEEIYAQKLKMSAILEKDDDADGNKASNADGAGGDGAGNNNNNAGGGASSDEEDNTTPIVIAVVVVVVFAALAAAVVVFVCKHRAYDEVYGSAGGRGIYGGPAVYGNPVYAAQPGTVPPQGFMSTAASQDYKAQYSAGPPPAAAKKGGGLVRQESMC